MIEKSMITYITDLYKYNTRFSVYILLLKNRFYLNLSCCLDIQIDCLRLFLKNTITVNTDIADIIPMLAGSGMTILLVLTTSNIFIGNSALKEYSLDMLFESISQSIIVLPL